MSDPTLPLDSAPPPLDATPAPPQDASPPPATPPAPAQEPVYELQVPEGYAVNEDIKSEFVGLVKELKLDPKDAQRFADLSLKMQQKQAEDYAKAREEWIALVKTDKDIGGEAMNENLAIARKGLDTFGTPELKYLLETTGFGNHPEIIKAFWRVGKKISEDHFVAGGTGHSTGAASDARRLYSTSNMNP